MKTITTWAPIVEQSVDIDGDGVPDIKYVPPTKEQMEQFDTYINEYINLFAAKETEQTPHLLEAKREEINQWAESVGKGWNAEEHWTGLDEDLEEIFPEKF